MDGRRHGSWLVTNRRTRIPIECRGRDASDVTLHFVHVSDSHVGAAHERRARDLARLEQLVERLSALHASEVPIDFVVHTGDLADDADSPDATPDTTEAALRLLDALPVRWFMLNGNHDRRAFLTRGAGAANGARATGRGEVPVTDATGVAVRRVGDVQLLFVDANPARGGPADVHGIVGDATIATLRRHVDRHPARSVVFLHYPPLAQEATWPGACVGGEALHAALAVRSDRIHGVFVGHNHRALHHLRDGVLYVTAPALTRQFLLWPGQATMAADEEPVAGLHYVTLGADGSTRVQHHAFVTAPSSVP